jgi:hypothetical protein
MSSDSDTDVEDNEERELTIHQYAQALNVIYMLVWPILLLSTVIHIWIRQTQEPLFSVEMG